MEYVIHVLNILEDGLQFRDLVPLLLIFSGSGYRVGEIMSKRRELAKRFREDRRVK